MMHSMILTKTCICHESENAFTIVLSLLLLKLIPIATKLKLFAGTAKSTPNSVADQLHAAAQDSSCFCIPLSRPCGLGIAFAPTRVRGCDDSNLRAAKESLTKLSITAVGALQPIGELSFVFFT